MAGIPRCDFEVEKYHEILIPGNSILHDSEVCDFAIARRPCFCDGNGLRTDGLDIGVELYLRVLVRVEKSTKTKTTWAAATKVQSFIGLIHRY